MKLFGIVILSIAALVVLLLVVLPAALVEILTLIIYRYQYFWRERPPRGFAPGGVASFNFLAGCVLMVLVLSW